MFRNVFPDVIFACGFTSGEGWDGNSGGLRQSGGRRKYSRNSRITGVRSLIPSPVLRPRRATGNGLACLFPDRV